MEFSKDDLKEAKRQINSTLHKLRETIKTFWVISIDLK